MVPLRHEGPGGSRHAIAQTTIAGQTQDAAGHVTLLVHEVRTDDSRIRKLRLIGDVGDDRRAALSKQSKEGAGCLAGRGVAQLHHEIREAHVGRQLRPGHTARHDTAPRNAQTLEQRAKSLRGGRRANEEKAHTVQVRDDSGDRPGHGLDLLLLAQQPEGAHDDLVIREPQTPPQPGNCLGGHGDLTRVMRHDPDLRPWYLGTHVFRHGLVVDHGET